MSNCDPVAWTWQRSNAHQGSDEFRSNRCKWRRHKWRWTKWDSSNGNRSKPERRKDDVAILHLNFFFVKWRRPWPFYLIRRDGSEPLENLRYVGFAGGVHVQFQKDHKSGLRMLKLMTSSRSVCVSRRRQQTTHFFVFEWNKLTLKYIGVKNYLKFVCLLFLVTFVDLTEFFKATKAF